jgi:hypothetical protein
MDMVVPVRELVCSIAQDCAEVGLHNKAENNNSVAVIPRRICLAAL